MADLTGRRFGKLVVTGPSFVRGSSRRITPCACDCGKKVDVRENNLTSGNTSSCGCGRVVNLTGQTFGKLEVLRLDKVDDCGAWWWCRCECGIEKSIRASHLKCGDAKSCGHIEDLTGKRYGRLLVLGRDFTPRHTKNKRVWWACLCDCGGTVSVVSLRLKLGQTRSCGCLLKEIKTTHGMTGTPTYKVWDGMIQRCNNPLDANYNNYGGRGIKVCERWHEFKNFVADMGVRPNNLELDRNDNAKGYSPDNCSWVTRKENCRNTRHNRYLTYKGETRCLSEWAEITGITVTAIRARRGRQWSIEKTLSTPVQVQYRKK